MAKFDVIDLKNKKVSEIELSDEIFAAEPNANLFYEVAKMQQINRRAGTVAVKNSSLVSGGGKKPWRQKGTGRARQGSTRAPQWVGGGTVHGPQPRSYAQRTPKKMVGAALRGALSDMARDNRIFVVTSLVDGDKPSTKQAKAVLSGLAELRKVLVVLDRSDEIDWLSVRNLSEVHVLAADQLNTYDVVNARTIVFSQAGLDAFVGARSANTQALSAQPEVPETNVADQHPYGEDSFRGDNPPAGFDIKGNEDSMKFHEPSSPWYGRTIAEVWFRSAAAAEAAGFVNAVKSDSEKEDAK